MSKCSEVYETYLGLANFVNCNQILGYVADQNYLALAFLVCILDTYEYDMRYVNDKYLAK